MGALVAVHLFESLAGEPGLLAGYSDRAGGVSDPPYDELNLAFHVGDDPDAVAENRRRLAATLGVELGALVLAEQVHGGRVVRVTGADRGAGAHGTAGAIPDADALVTADAGVVLAVLVADCVPIVLHDPAVPAVGIVHAGREGTLAHVARNAVAAMRDELGCDPARLQAALGPSIGPDSYAVDAETAGRAGREFPEADVARRAADGRHLLDLWAANGADLAAAGVAPAAVELAGLDTLRDERFFSHRRARPTGRFSAFVALRPAA